MSINVLKIELSTWGIDEATGDAVEEWEPGFTTMRTRPFVEITSPQDGAVLGVAQNAQGLVVSVQGTVYDLVSRLHPGEDPTVTVNDQPVGLTSLGDGRFSFQATVSAPSDLIRVIATNAFGVEGWREIAIVSESSDYASTGNVEPVVRPQSTDDLNSLTDYVFARHSYQFSNLTYVGSALEGFDVLMTDVVDGSQSSHHVDFAGTEEGESDIPLRVYLSTDSALRVVVLTPPNPDPTRVEYIEANTLYLSGLGQTSRYAELIETDIDSQVFSSQLVELDVRSDVVLSDGVNDEVDVAIYRPFQPVEATTLTEEAPDNYRFTGAGGIVVQLLDESTCDSPLPVALVTHPALGLSSSPMIIAAKVPNEVVPLECDEFRSGRLVLYSRSSVWQAIPLPAGSPAPDTDYVFPRYGLTVSPPILDPNNVDMLDIQLVDNSAQGAVPTTVVFIETAVNSRAFESQDGTVYVRFDSSFGTDPAETPTIPRIHAATIQAQEASRTHVWAADLIETGIVTGMYKSNDTSVHAVVAEGLRTDASDTISAELSPVFGSLANLELTETASDSLEFTDVQGNSLGLFRLIDGETGPDPFGELLFILGTAAGDVLGGVLERDVTAEGPGEWCLKTSPVVYSKPTTTAVPRNGSGSVVFRARVIGYPDLLPPQRPSRIRIHAAPEFLEEEPISVTTSSGATFSIDMSIEEGVLTSGPIVVDCQATGDIGQVLDGWPVKIWGNILGEQDPPEYVRLTFEAPDGSTVHSRGPVQVLAPDDEDHTTMRMDVGQNLNAGGVTDFKLTRVEAYDPDGNLVSYEYGHVRLDGASWKPVLYGLLLHKGGAALAAFEATLRAKAPPESSGDIVYLYIGPRSFADIKAFTRGFARGAGEELRDSVNPIQVFRGLYELTQIDWSKIKLDEMAYQVFITNFDEVTDAAADGLAILGGNRDLAPVRHRPDATWPGKSGHRVRVLGRLDVAGRDVAGPFVVRLDVLERDHLLHARRELLAGAGLVLGDDLGKLPRLAHELLRLAGVLELQDRDELPDLVDEQRGHLGVELHPLVPLQERGGRLRRLRRRGEPGEIGFRFVARPAAVDLPLAVDPPPLVLAERRGRDARELGRLPHALAFEPELARLLELRAVNPHASSPFPYPAEPTPIVLPAIQVNGLHSLRRAPDGDSRR